MGLPYHPNYQFLELFNYRTQPTDFFVIQFESIIQSVHNQAVQNAVSFNRNIHLFFQLWIFQKFYFMIASGLTNILYHECTWQIRKLLEIARSVVKFNRTEYSSLEYMIEKLDDLKYAIHDRKVDALVVETFGRRIEKLIQWVIIWNHEMWCKAYHICTEIWIFPGVAQ